MDESGGGAVATEEQEQPPRTQEEEQLPRTQEEEQPPRTQEEEQLPRTQEEEQPPRTQEEILAHVQELFQRMVTHAMEEHSSEEPSSSDEDEVREDSGDDSFDDSDDDESDCEEIEDEVEVPKWNDLVTLPKMEIDDMNCSICMAPWTNGGTHQISCLPCGHLFGACCIEKLLKHCKSSKKCPQCNQECSLKDVRVIYAPQIVVVDHELQKKVESLESKCASLEKKVHDLENYGVRMDKLKVLETNTKELHTEMSKNHTELMEVQTRFLKLVEDDYRVRRLMFPGFYVNKPPYISYKSSSSTPSVADPSK